MGEKQDAKGVSDSEKTGETIKEQETQIAKEQNTIEEDFPDGIDGTCILLWMSGQH